MRFAYIAGSLRARSELIPGPVDFEWLSALGAKHRLGLLVDHDSLSARALKCAGVPTAVAPKREISTSADPLDSSSLLSSDAAQAKRLREWHAEEPFDFLLYDTDRTTDLAWFEPELSPIPRGIVLNGEFLRDLHLALDIPQLAEFYWRDLSAVTGHLRGADFLVTNVPAEAFGLRSENLGPCRATMAISARDPGRKERTGDQGRLTFISASSVALPHLSTLIETVTAAVPGIRGGTVIVFHAGIMAAGYNTADLILAGLPRDMEGSVILVSPDATDTAFQFLQVADIVVGASPGDLAIIGVAERLTHSLVSTPDPIPFALDSPVQVRVPGAVELFDASRGLAGLPEWLAHLRASDADTVILFKHESELDAGRLLDYTTAGHTGDVILVAAPTGKYGAGSHSKLRDDIVAFRRPVWHAIALLARQAVTIERLIAFATSPSLLDRLSITYLPGTRTTSHYREVSSVTPPLWAGESGVLRRPMFGLDQFGSESFETWLQSASWRRRALLALPWRWGLLAKALKRARA